jgi:uncharacterized protein (TIGR00730 family)
MSNTVCVFCGSSPKVSPYHIQLAAEVAQALVHANFHLVYGGGGLGLMGSLATTVIDLGGHITGVIPKKLIKMEKADLAVTHLHVVETMHERKAKMEELSKAFLVLPGGIGTLDELFCTLTNKQIGFYQKPIVLLNDQGFYDKLLDYLTQKNQEGFLHHPLETYLSVVDNIPDAVRTLTHLLTNPSYVQHQH